MYSKALYYHAFDISCMLCNMTSSTVCTATCTACCLQPLLPYIAPELVSGFGGTSSIGPPADVFSLATVVYELLSSGSPLLTVRNNINEYKARVAALPQGGMQDPLSSLPLPIQGNK